jgi:hypothetical protein
MRLPRLLALAALLGLLGSCGILEPRREERLTLYVAPARLACMGVAPQECLQVRYRPDEAWGFFYDPIEGFAYEPGYAYTLLVARRRIPDPPQDASSYRYRLLRILEKRPATLD